MQSLIRTAVAKDLEAIRQLVIELAVFEKEPHAVTATLDDYIDAFQNGEIYIQVAEVKGEIVGMVLYYLAFSTWKGKMMYLEDFYVKKTFRKLGIGLRLFNTFINDSRDKGCVLTKWQVLDWNQSAIDFYKKIGADIETEWLNGKLRL